MSNSASYYAQWELVEHKVQYERRTKTIVVGGMFGPGIVYSNRQYRPVIIKTYEATIQDADPSVAELPCPTYYAGSNFIDANPESLSPQGWGEGQWHIVDIQYSKQLSEPLSRKCRISWEQFGVWTTYESDESDSQ